MAYGFILAFPAGVGETEYEAVNSHLSWDRFTGEGMPDGMLSHTAGMSDDEGLLVSEVWESKETQAAFMAEQLGAALGAARVPDPARVTWFEIVTNVQRA